jgi:Zn-dependent protease
MEIVTTLFIIVILIISIVFHELAHGAVANWLGDPTARLAGRLTLNPISHMEWMGSFVLPFLCIISGSGFIIGWAKPVPFNPRLLKNQRWGPALVAIAGPLTNIIFALLGAITFRFLGNPIFYLVVTTNVALFVFNLIPIPPLDGHHILGALIPQYQRWSDRLMQGYGFVIMILVILFAGSFISPVISFITNLLIG